MRRFRRLRLSVAGWVRWAVLAMALAYLLVRLADLLIWTPMTVVAENEARLKAIDAINRIVLGSMEGMLDPQKLVTYEKDQEGNIAAYYINTQVVNHVASQAAVAVRGEFGKQEFRSFHVPLGALLGSRFLSALGPQVPVYMIPVGSVVIDIRQEFKAEGINQTRHRLWLHVDARVRVVLPMVSREVTVTSDLPVTETVVLGKVPNVFGGNLGGITVPLGTPAPGSSAAPGGGGTGQP